jgi:hypothetical protein
VRGALAWRYGWGDLAPVGVHNFAGGTPFTVLGVASSRDAGLFDAEARFRLSPAKPPSLVPSAGGYFECRRRWFDALLPNKATSVRPLEEWSIGVEVGHRTGLPSCDQIWSVAHCCELLSNIQTCCEQMQLST